jgi:hypothetical protein
MNQAPVQSDIVTDEATMAATLAEFDVRYLRASTEVEPASMTPTQLIAALAQHPSPRVRESLLPLFLRHPEFARHVPNLALTLPPAAATTLRHLYTAAVYLQHLWRGQLENYLGEHPWLPDYFGQSEWQLPPPTVHYGEAGLRLLAHHFQARTGDNWLNTYETAVSLFRQQLMLETFSI